jgi:hypothetical protein
MEINLEDLLDLVYKEDTVIITCDSGDVKQIRKSLSQTKFYRNKNLQEQGLLPDVFNNRLYFSEKSIENDKTVLTISIREPRTVKILSIKTQCDEQGEIIL